MLVRRLARTVLEPQSLTHHSMQLPPPFLLPLRARRNISSTPSIIDPPPPQNIITPNIYSDDLDSPWTASPSTAIYRAPVQHAPKQHALPPQPKGPPLQPSTPSRTDPVPESVTGLLPLLAAQSPHYATVRIHARPYLVTQGDVIRLPFKMPGVSPGDVLRLTCVSALGSRDFTLRGDPHVDGRLFCVRAIVSGVESEPMRFMEKTKRRQRRIKTVKSKMRFTELTVREISVRSVEEVERGEEGKEIEEER